MDRTWVNRRLDAHLESAGGAIPANTARALRSDVAIFCKWCEERNLVPVPANRGTLVAFTRDMTKSKSPATVRRYVASVATLHRFLGKANPAATEPVRQELKRLRNPVDDDEPNRGSRKQAPVEGLNWALCRRLIEASGTRVIDARNRALLAVAYDTLLHRRELALLEVRGLVEHADGSATVRLPGTQGANLPENLFLARDTAGHLREWLERAGIREHRLFRSIRVNGDLGESLRPSQIARIYKTMARTAGFSPEIVARVSGQSTRAGAVQDMLAAGVDLATILQAGRGRGATMVQRYAEGVAAADNAAVQPARQQQRQ